MSSRAPWCSRRPARSRSSTASAASARSTARPPATRIEGLRRAYGQARSAHKRDSPRPAAVDVPRLPPAARLRAADAGEETMSPLRAALALAAGLLAGPALAETLVVCTEASPDFLNPQFSNQNTAYDVSSQIYERLVGVERGGSALTPALAES